MKEILDQPYKAREVRIPWFQLTEIGLYIPLLLTFIFRNDRPEFIILIYPYLFFLVPIIFSFYRIVLEYRKALISKPGILLRILLVCNCALVAIGLHFMILQISPEFILMRALSLLALSIPYVLQALFLKKCTWKFKSVLLLNALSIGILAIGILFKIQSWPFGSEMIQTGLILSFCSSILLLIYWSKSTNKIEIYHGTFYLFRSLGLAIVFFFGIESFNQLFL